MKAANIKQHLLCVHPQYKDKNKNFSERYGNTVTMIKLVSTDDCNERDQKVAETSYVVALEIAKQRKPHAI